MIYIYLDWSVHMKRFLCLLLLLALALSLGACGREDTTEEENKPVTIVTTVFPAYDFARQIAGERAAVCLLVPPGAEAHSFEPTARDILRIQSCTLFFRNGGESEAWVEELLEDRDVETLAMLLAEMKKMISDPNCKKLRPPEKITHEILQHRIPFHSIMEGLQRQTGASLCADAHFALMVNLPIH